MIDMDCRRRNHRGMSTNKKFVMTFMKDNEGKEVKYKFLISMTKTLKELEKTFGPAMMSIDGIDGLDPVGRYTVAVSVCLAFDAEEVVAKVEAKLEELLSDIVRPRLLV